MNRGFALGRGYSAAVMLTFCFGFREQQARPVPLLFCTGHFSHASRRLPDKSEYGADVLLVPRFQLV
jgi:hypothetical protein